MEPNQNVPGVGSTQPAASTTSTTSTTPTTSSTSSTEAGPVFRDAPKTKSHAMVLGMICLAILAVGGIGFGVWAYLDGNAQVAKLNEQITSLNSTIAELQTVNEEEAIVDENGVVTTTETGDYIYVGEWGIKIGIPENLEQVSYEVTNWDENDFAGTRLCVTGATTGHGDASPSFVKDSTDGPKLGCLGKNTKSISEENGGEGYATIPVGEYYFVGPQTFVGDGTDSDWEVESVNVIKTMLEDENNITPIK